jgi:glycosyltransferase involved in cell wall biosynthesis
MRILLLTHNLAGMGGSFLRAHALGGGLAALGHQVTLAAARKERGLRRLRESVDGVGVLQGADFFPERLRQGGLSPLDVLGRLTSVPRVDLIHGFDHRPSVSFPSLWLRRRFGVPFVSDWADLWGKGGIAEERRSAAGRVLGFFDDYWERTIHRRADGVTVVTEELRRRAEELGVPRERIRKVGVGSSCDRIRPLPREAMRARYGLPENAPIVVHTGFAPYDRPLLAKTLYLLTQRNPELMAVLTGRPDADLVALAPGRIRHLGIVPFERMGEILACGDVMILPHTRRPLNTARFPNRLGDYLAAGRPIATNRTGEVGELVEAEGVGLAVGEDPEEFARAIQDLLEDEETRRDMGERARRLAETKRSWAVMARELDEFYREIASATRSRPSAVSRGTFPR